jgi:hypothetical protein
MTKALFRKFFVIAIVFLLIGGAGAGQSDGQTSKSALRRSSRTKIKPDDKEAMATADKAKAALLIMIDANKESSDQFKEDFTRAKIEELRQAPVEKFSARNTYLFHWGGFSLDLKKKTYIIGFGNALSTRTYQGKFSTDKDGLWTAEDPATTFADSVPWAK